MSITATSFRPVFGEVGQQDRRTAYTGKHANRFGSVEEEKGLIGEVRKCEVPGELMRDRCLWTVGLIEAVLGGLIFFMAVCEVLGFVVTLVDTFGRAGLDAFGTLSVARYLYWVYVGVHSGLSGVFGAGVFVVGVPRSFVLVRMGRRAVTRVNYSRSGKATFTDGLVYAMSFGLLVAGSVCGASSVVFPGRVLLSVALTVVSTSMGFVVSVRGVARRYGDVGMLCAVLMQVALCMGGIPFIVCTYGLFCGVQHCVSLIPDKGPGTGGGTGVHRCTQRMQELTRRMCVDMSRVDGYLSPSIIDRAGAVPQGMHESEELRRLAYLGDRVMSLALASRAQREKWTVEASSCVSQSVLTNAAFAKWLDLTIVDMFRNMVGRSEKRKGTLVEALIGAAYQSGCSLAEIEVFVFTQVANKSGIHVTETGVVSGVS